MKSLRPTRLAVSFRAFIFPLALSFAVVLLAGNLSAAQATLRPSKDTTIYGEGDANLSNGGGRFLFAGSSGFNGGSRTLRSLIAFDLAGQIPAGATINSVTLTLGVDTPLLSNRNTVRLHRVLADWGEGSARAPMGEGGGALAAPGDATWNSRFLNTSTWTTPGGDFTATASATQPVTVSSGSLVMTSSGLVTDVQAWVNNAATNFGWILVAADESGPAVRFASKDGSPAPSLVIDFTPGSGGSNAAPLITTQPVAQSVSVGGTVTLTVAATGTPAPTYQWLKDGTPITGATGATLSLANVTAAQAGNYSVVVSNAVGNVPSSIATVTVNAVTPPPPSGGSSAWLANLSILTSITTAGDSFTMGFVVGGSGTSGSKPVLIRAAGPALTQLGVTGVLADPRLEIFSGSTSSGTNDNWGGTAALIGAFTAVGAFPYISATSLDAAAIAGLGAGDNSVRVSGTGNATGSVIAELYDSTPAATFSATTPRLVNVSVLKHIGSGLTAGFVIAGTSTQTVLIRAVGPTIGAAPFNVGGAIADPQLTLFSGQTAVGSNDNWGGTAALTAAFSQVGAFSLPATSRDAALLTTLQPGQYTVQVSGVGNTTGVAIVEVYEVR